MKNLHRSSKELAQIIWKTRTDCPKNPNRSSEKLQGLCEELPQLIGFQWLKTQDLHQFTQTAQTFLGFASNTPSLRQECKCKAHLIHAVYQRFCWLGWVCWICPEPASRLLWLTLIRHIPSVCDWYVWPSLMLLVRQLIFSPLAQSWTRLENTHNSVETRTHRPWCLHSLCSQLSSCDTVPVDLWLKNFEWRIHICDSTQQRIYGSTRCDWGVLFMTRRIVFCGVMFFTTHLFIPGFDSA